MKSTINSKEIVIEQHKHRASEVYYPCVFKDQAGREQKLLFTAQEIEDAKKRVKTVVIPEKEKPWWKLW